MSKDRKIDSLSARVKELEATLREHHNWHLRSGTIGLQDGDGGWIEIDNAAEYSDSTMYERTEKLLSGAPPEELQPMPRGGMNMWWWEQAVLLRRQTRKLRKIISDCAGALPNGAMVSPEASLDFMEKLPGEIASVCGRLRQERDEADEPVAQREKDEDEAYEIGKRDGYESAVQDFDLATGGDGEFKGSTIPGGTVDVPAMKRRVIERFKAIPTVAYEAAVTVEELAAILDSARPPTFHAAADIVIARYDLTPKADGSGK